MCELFRVHFNADFLDYWVDTYASFNLHYSTTVAYINIIKNHVKPRIGYYQLWQLDTRLLQEFINQIYVEYSFSKNYMASILKVVKGSLKYACYTLNYINSNQTQQKSNTTTTTQPSQPSNNTSTQNNNQSNTNNQKKVVSTTFYDSITGGKREFSSESAAFSRGTEIQNKELDYVLNRNETHPDNQIQPDINYFRVYPSAIDENGKYWYYLHFFCQSGEGNDAKLKSMY